MTTLAHHPDGARAKDTGDLSVVDFKRIAKVLFDDAGIALPDAKRQLAYARLSKRLRLLKIKGFGEYCDLLESGSGANERRNMLAALTTNVTRFFREPHHFDDLRTTVLPPLIRAAQKGARVRIWSAGCSSGEEPYSIGLTALGLFSDLGNLDFKILATDIDPNILARARSGEYPAEALVDVPAGLRQSYFETGSGAGTMRVTSTLRNLLTINELNLIRPWPVKGPFDVIFCRNVVIYFGRETQRKLWDDFTRVLGPQGRLYIGHSERLCSEAEQRFKSVGVTAYEKAI